MTEKKKTEIEQNFSIGPNGQIKKLNGEILTPSEGKTPAILPVERKKKSKPKTDKLGIDQTLGQDPEVEFKQDSGDDFYLSSSQEPEKDFDPSIEPIIVKQHLKKHRKVSILNTLEKPKAIEKNKKSEIKSRKPRTRRVQFIENP